MIKKKFEESEYIELKKSTSELTEAVISIAAMLNKHGKGEVFFGIKNNGEVVGQQISENTLRDVSQSVSNNIEPKIYPEIEKVMIEDKSCIHIEFSGKSNELYYAFGRPYIRVSDEDKKLSPQEIETRIRSKIKSEVVWDKEISDTGIKQINNTVVRDFFERALQAGRITYKVSAADVGIKKLGLVKNEKLTNAGKVLFGKNTDIEFQMAIFAGTEKLTFLDIGQIKGNIFFLLDETEKYIRNHINWRVQFGKMEREEIPEIPIAALREALVNSLCHRDYTVSESNKVAIFRDRIEIYNPGNFPDGITPEDYIKKNEASILRNPSIADVLYKSKDIEKWASGLKRIFNECLENKIKVEFKCMKTGFATVFYRPEINDETIKNYQKKTSEKITPELHSNCTRIALEIFDLLKENKYITIKEISKKINAAERTIKYNIKELKEKKLIKRVGPDKGGYWELKENYNDMQR